jgi:hypothetical protein
VFEGEVLVVQYHPLRALLAGKTLDIGKHSDWHQHHPSVGEVDCHHASFLSEVKLLDSKIGVFIFAHVAYIVFDLQKYDKFSEQPNLFLKRTATACVGLLAMAFCFPQLSSPIWASL